MKGFTRPNQRLNQHRKGPFVIGLLLLFATLASAQVVRTRKPNEAVTKTQESSTSPAPGANKSIIIVGGKNDKVSTDGFKTRDLPRPPYILANPNPVKVEPGKQSATTKLEWDAGVDH